MSVALFGNAGPTRVKVCCIASVEEAEVALFAGADALGLVSAMPSGPGVISDRRIAEVIERVQGRGATVLLTSRRTAASIGRQLRQLRPTVLQIVDAIEAAELAKLRDAYPRLLLMPVVHVTTERSLADAVMIAAAADAILLDSGNPSAAVKELGGTGRVHDWTVSLRIREAIGIPLFLAGGLRPGNVADAVRTVVPHGVDVCSGVRRDGQLDPAMAAAFVAAARDTSVRRIDA